MFLLICNFFIEDFKKDTNSIKMANSQTSFNKSSCTSDWNAADVLGS